MWLVDLCADVFFFWLYTNEGSDNPDQSIWAWVRLVLVVLFLIGVAVAMWMIFNG